jgi:hypothetical protein
MSQGMKTQQVLAVLDQLQSYPYCHQVRHSMYERDGNLFISLVVPCYEQIPNIRFWRYLASPALTGNPHRAYLSRDIAQANIANSYFVSQYVEVHIPLTSIDLEVLLLKGIAEVMKVKPQNENARVVSSTIERRSTFLSAN